MTTEAFSRVFIDQMLTDQGWNLTDGTSVRYEYTVPDKSRADYVLCDRRGRSMAVVEAKRFSVNPSEGQKQARDYAEQLDVPYVFLANGRELLVWDYRREAFPRPIKTFFRQDDLERRMATLQVRRDPLTIPVDRTIADRDYQSDCIDALCRGIAQGRRKLLVEMATGTGKTRTAAALIKRLFEAGAVTRVLFLVDRIQLAGQTEDAFTEHLRDYPCYVLRQGRRFQDEKRITITTLQSMINIYHQYSSGYFDLVISDECHRSIYGTWGGVLKHFDSIQIGLTATPCVAANVDDLPEEEDKAAVRDTLRFFEVDRPDFTYGLSQAIRDGYLVPYQIYKAKTVKTAADGGFEVKRTELDWSNMDNTTRTELEKLFDGRASIVVDPSALERRFTIPERNRAMVREFGEVMRNGYLDPNHHVRKPIPGKTIVFAVTKRHAETLAQMFDNEFTSDKPSPEVRYADYVVSGMGQDDTVDGITKIKRFLKEKYPQILVSVNMLDTGFDCPEVMNLVFARFTKSQVLYRQMRGRGTRKSKGKPVFTLFDFVGITDFHGDDETYSEGGYAISSKPRARTTATPRRPLALDIDDRIDPTTREWVTVDEEGRLVFASPQEEKANAIAARFESWLLSLRLTPDQERLMRMVGNQIRANSDQWDGFTEDHFAFPPFSQIGGHSHAVRAFGNEQALRATIESLNNNVFGD
jgi:type I restriction enzyme R subunit